VGLILGVLLQGRLYDVNGNAICSEDRADTFAEYLETVQWAVRPATVVDDAPLFSELPVRTSPITFSELLDAVKAFKPGKATGPDTHPVEYWRVVLESGTCSEGSSWLLLLCNTALDGCAVPKSWHLSRVATIYKKGDPGDCGNYRPICLLNAAYKVFAMVLFRRLMAAGANSRIWSSQYGFRPNSSTEDALHCVRRAVERAWGERGGRLHLLALDWRKAFDSIDPAALLNALRRFGLPVHFRRVVEEIYTDRSFFVKDSGQSSDKRKQMSGICQGCPLSPFLFIIVMTVIMHDAVASLGPSSALAYSDSRLFDVLYADDTLLIGSTAADVEALALAVERIGTSYGMSLHWGKTQALSVCTPIRIKRPDGSVIEEKASLHYLGASIYSDGRADSEISRKLGTARLETCKCPCQSQASIFSCLDRFTFNLWLIQYVACCRAAQTPGWFLCSLSPKYFADCAIIHFTGVKCSRAQASWRSKFFGPTPSEADDFSRQGRTQPCRQPTAQRHFHSWYDSASTGKVCWSSWPSASGLDEGAHQSRCCKTWPC